MLENTRRVTKLANEYEYLRSLNTKQQIVASQKEGNHLVLAGPGTGKTHTLAYRTMHLIEEGIDPSSIALITFTRKAANTLRMRLGSLLPNVEIGFIGTFHELSSFILNDANNINRWRLIDKVDDHAFLNITCNAGSLGTGRLSDIFSHYANTKLPMKDVLKRLGHTELEPYAERLELAYVHYMAAKARAGYLNYDDMLMQPINNPHLVDCLNFDYLMIDEFQDVTKLQLEFITSLKIPNVMIIGDDFQNIYSFRGTDNKLMLSVDEYFEDPSLITLETNYRSSKQICDLVNSVVERTNYGFPKYVESVTEDEEFGSEFALRPETEFIDGIIESIHSKTGSHGIIARTKKDLYAIERKLIENKISYQFNGGVNLLGKKHVKDLLSIMSLIYNPSDYLAHVRVLKTTLNINDDKAKELLDNVSLVWQNEIITKSLLEYKLLTNEQIFRKACNYYFKYIKGDIDIDTIKRDFIVIMQLLQNYPSVVALVNDCTLEPTVDYKSVNRCDVFLTTIHSSKGLEFDNVHLLHELSNQNKRSLDRLEEEARLFYVAISRAKHNLTIYDTHFTTRSFNQLVDEFTVISRVPTAERQRIQAKAMEHDLNLDQLLDLLKNK